MSGRAARLLTDALVTTAEGLRIIDIPRGSNLRDQLEWGLKKGVVELPVDKDLGRQLRLDEVHAHHMFPQRFKDDLAKLGIDNERYAAWWKTQDHLRLARQYNEETEAMLERVRKLPTERAKMQEMAKFLKDQSEQYTLTVYFLAGG